MGKALKEASRLKKSDTTPVREVGVGYRVV